MTTVRGPDANVGATVADDPTATAASDECVPPCPVAEGAMGLLCTCGNVVKRWEATKAMLRDQPDTAAGRPRSPAEAAALGKRLADEGHAVGWQPTTAAWILVPCPTCGVEARKHCESDPVMVGFVHMARHDLAVVTPEVARSVRRD